MNKKPVEASDATISGRPASESEAPSTPAVAPEPASETGLLASIKHAKDFVVDKMSHPKETAGAVKEWAQRSAHTVDAALDGAQDALAAVSSSIGQAREWTADRAEQVDRIFARAQEVVSKLDDSVEAVQGSTNRVAEALGEAPASDYTRPAEEPGSSGDPADAGELDEDIAPGVPLGFPGR